MSVINKMLRDLDSRKHASTVEIQNPMPEVKVVERAPGEPPFTRALVKPRLSKQNRRTLMTFLLLGLAGAALWFLNSLPNAGAKLAQPVVAVVPTPASSVVAVPEPAPVALPVSVAQPVVPIVPQMAVQSANSTVSVDPVVIAAPVSAVVAPKKQDAPIIAARTPLKSVASAKVQAPAVARLPVPESLFGLFETSLRMDNSLKKVPAASKEFKPAPSSLAQTERGLTESVQKSTLNALAQAQSLWTAGSRSAAADLLREALIVAERTVKPAANNAELAALARELARMELAEGQTSQALAMLTRLEPMLSGSADVWAIRGNAAQRLGQHEESVAAYRAALKLRPDESRWMLGAAVSLAVQGQVDGAAELAEKARASGALSVEVATYLRQLGVVLRDR